MQDSDFQFYQKILVEKSGISLMADKAYLLTSRLAPVAQSLGYESLERFTHYLRVSNDTKIIATVIEAMTTNETSFFRDGKPFQQLKDKIFPYLHKKNDPTKTIRIWSAACSTGQEAYSVAMVAQEFFQDKPGWKVQITGTDLSTEVVKRAQAGIYNQFEIQRGLPLPMMIKYFTQDGNNWIVKDVLKAGMRFQLFNLMDDMSVLGKFDIILCRNVLIYFNQGIKAKILGHMVERLVPDGFLMLGSCETVLGVSKDFESLPSMHGVHVLKSQKHALIAS